MHLKSKLMSAVLAAFAISASSAFADTQATPVPQVSSGAYSQLARNGADDPVPGCDDHGTDIVCNTSAVLAKNGADDPVPGCDDHGTDIVCNASAVLAKNGADDLIDELDDSGVDFVAG